MKEVNSKTYIKWFKDMLFWRKFEDKCRSLYLQQKIRGFLHLYNGQEAIPAGLIHAMDTSKDRVITAYRCHILPMALGVDPKKILAELCGKVTGTSKGLGGSMHIFDKKHNFFGGHGIVGGQIPLGAGIAFADKYFNNDSVTITLMGDGAVRQGSFHETFNLSMIWKLPVVFICENNKYAMGTSVDRSSNIQDIYKLGLSYDMPSYVVTDGMNPELIAKYIYKSITRCRNGLGPSFIEIKTYRYRGHSISDASSYRTKEEVNKYKNLDPINRIEKILLSHKWVDENKLLQYKQEVNNKIKECVEYADKSDFPNKEQMYNFVYKELNYPFIDNIS
jgi:pyruvate dehydrogenase E1 component alpha subunit